MGYWEIGISKYKNYIILFYVKRLKFFNNFFYIFGLSAQINFGEIEINFSEIQKKYHEIVQVKIKHHRA